MIDTDKYEGHTEGPWIALNDNAVKTPKHDDPMAFIERRNDDGYVVSLSKADAQLIADAPLLLAEVKRLREENDDSLNQIAQMATIITDLFDWFNDAPTILSKSLDDIWQTIDKEEEE